MHDDNLDTDTELSSPLPTIRTERFVVYKHEIDRPEEMGGMPRSVFHAWYHSDDIPHPVCVVTINECFGNYVEWILVDEYHRRQGIAMEVIRAIELSIGMLTMFGATPAGVAFCDAYEAKYPEAVE